MADDRKRKPAGTLSFRYEFDLGDAGLRVFEIEIDARTLRVGSEERTEPPAWTRLGFQQCANCPLSTADCARCPVAVNIARVVEEFEGAISYAPVAVKVTSPHRTYSKEVPLQQGMFSLLGLIMATSDCPHLSFLKPMARFHLPFATTEETLVRTVSMHMLRQYFKWKRDGGNQFDLAELESAYAQLKQVNRGLAERIRSATTGDANANAIVILDSLARFLSTSLAIDLANVEELAGA